MDMKRIQGLIECMILINTRSWKAFMTLSFSRLKDGDKAESFKLRNLDVSKDSEEANVQPVTVDDHNEYSSKEGKQQFRGSRRRI